MKKIIISIISFIIVISMGLSMASAFGQYTSTYARHVLRAAARLEEELPEYDLNGDRKITTEDARIALRRAAGLSDYEPPTTTVAPTTTIVVTTTETPKKEYYQIGVLSTCGLSESELKNGLRGVLKDYADVFLAAEEEYNVNAVFLAAVAALESGWGSSWLAQNKNNLYGWKGGSGFKYFESKSECIMFVARNLRKTYLTPGGGCFYGYDVEDIQRCYCPGGDWASQVYGLMSMIKRNAY